METFLNLMRAVAVDSEESGVRGIATEMARQMVAAHTSLTIIHIGCDKV